MKKYSAKIYIRQGEHEKKSWNDYLRNKAGFIHAHSRICFLSTANDTFLIIPSILLQSPEFLWIQNNLLNLPAPWNLHWFVDITEKIWTSFYKEDILQS